MARVKPHRATPSLDMTPMVDLAFLLVTFFMLTSTARTPDPLSVDMPSSVSDIKIPEKNIILISMASDGRVFFSLDGKYHRLELINQISERFNVQFTEEEKMRFALIESFGVPVAGLKNLLSYSADEMVDVAQQGIPVDSVNNELDDWIILSRVVNPQARVAIKGDRNAPYPVVKRVISTIQDKNINRFNLITNLEDE